MASGTLSVAVNYRILIHGAELQQQPFSGRNFGKLNRTEVPQIFFWKQLPLHAGRIAPRSDSSSFPGASADADIPETEALLPDFSQIP